MKPKALTDNDYKFAAEELDCEPALMEHLTNSSVGGTFQKEVMH